jgi:hypothetical protein
LEDVDGSDVALEYVDGGSVLLEGVSGGSGAVLEDVDGNEVVEDVGSVEEYELEKTFENDVD